MCESVECFRKMVDARDDKTVVEEEEAVLDAGAKVRLRIFK